MRLFFALWPDAATREALATAGRAFWLRDGRVEPAANLHLTLRFLGDVAATQLGALREAADRVDSPGFSLCISQAGWWRRSHVAWLAPGELPAALSALVARINALEPPLAAGSNFRPHITVARRVRRAPGLAQAFDVPWTVSSFALISSDPGRAGGRYELLQSWPLAAPGQG